MVLPRDKIDVELVRELVHSLMVVRVREKERVVVRQRVASRADTIWTHTSQKERESIQKTKKEDYQTKVAPKKNPTVSLKLVTNSSVSALFSSSSSSTAASIPFCFSARFFSFCVVCYM